MPNKPVRDIQDFLLSTYFADGLRITFGVLCPSLIFAQFGLFQWGLILSTGALCASIADTPGPIRHRRNAMCITTVLVTIVYILVGVTNVNVYLSGVVLVACTFIFSMFVLYGNRASFVGLSALLIMVLSIDDIRPWQELTGSAGLLFAGGVWYTILSYSIYRLRPFRVAAQTLSDSIIEVSNFLRVKAKFYHPGNDYDQTYKQLLQLQAEVSLKQDEVRDVLFRTREIVRESTPQGRFLVLVFTDMLDLFEQVMSTYYNYKQLHQQFAGTGIMELYERTILEIANSLDEIAFALKANGTPKVSALLNANVKLLIEEIAKLEQSQDVAVTYNSLGIIALKNIEVNIENILARIKTINSYFGQKNSKNLKSHDIDVTKFINKQDFGKKLLYENLSYSSSIFRHSLRVTAVMLIGFVLAKMLNFSHSYWILLTILVISKPGFSSTKARNYQRLIGTTIGAFIGMGFITYIDDKNILFGVLLVCMIGCYSFQRKNYAVSVLFMTPYILILFEFMGDGSISLARERIYDTLIGSGIAILGSYVLFPSWEHEKLRDVMLAMVRANLHYFTETAKLYFSPQSHQLTSYKVARKEVYVTSSNLSSLFQRMFSEPKSKQKYMMELHQFTVLNHLLTSYTASLSLYNRQHQIQQFNFSELAPVAANTEYLLKMAAVNLTQPKTDTVNVPLVRRKNDGESLNPQEIIVVSEQFDLIQKVGYDIFKLTEKVRI